MLFRFLIIAMIFVSDMASDIYAPALPEISDFFNIPEWLSSLTIGLNITGIAVGGLIYGPLSDYYGRRPFIIGGMSLFTVTSFLIFINSDFNVLLVLRFIQGLGEGAILLATACVEDVYSGAKRSRVLSQIEMVLCLAPAIAPLIGGYIITHFGWQYCFLFVFILGFLFWIFSSFKFPETLRDKSDPITPKTVFKSYTKLIKKKQFMIFTTIQCLTFGWLMGDIVNLPFVFIDGMGTKVQHYGYFVAFMVTMYILGTLYNQRYVEKNGLKSTLKKGLILNVFGGFCVLIGHFIFTLTPLFTTLLKIPGSFGLALVFPNATALALDQAKGRAGSASAFIGSAQMGIGALAGVIISVFYDQTMLPLAIVTVFAMTTALILFQKSQH